MLKDELQKRRLDTEAEITILRENQLAEKTTLLEEIQKNNMREQEIQKELEKEDNQAQENNGVVYIYIKSMFQTTGKFKRKSYRRIMNQQMQDIRNMFRNTRNTSRTKCNI